MKTRKTAKARTTALTSKHPVIAGKTAETPVPAPPASSFLVVGIGASAGGLAAFEAFFSGLPADTDPGMAFVLVQHLDPYHKSILTEIIRRYTRMPVFEVEDGMVVRPNCVYIIPPGCDLALLKGTLQLLPPGLTNSLRLPIDFFFRSLASDQHERAIGIVLSGTGSDGTLGVRAIKGEGGMVMVQSTASSEYDGMPRSTIATGLVDYELPPAEMPAQLRAYAVHAFGRPRQPDAVAAPKVESALKKIFTLLRVHTSHDFSQYKPNTINRRIERRMAVQQIEALDDYVKFLQRTPAEVETLFRDLLIGVTNFFRDPEAFAVLEQLVVPQLLADKRANAVIRVWAAGCATGEEAYSLAILLVEGMEARKQSYTIQIFATDIDSRAIATARTGLYPASIAADVSPERLARYFKLEPDGSAYRIHKGIRDLLVFSEQDLIKDPPFSKLDLITCRNLLIYLGTALQKKLIPLFHYALTPGGWLFLGTSEGVNEFDTLFTVRDRKAKLYQRKEDIHSLPPTNLNRFLPLPGALTEALPPLTARKAFPVKLPLRELTEQALLAQVVAAGALVNDRGDILYLHGRTGLFLEPAAGEAGINNILKMAREGLRHALTTALHQAADTKDTVRCPGLRIKTNGHFTLVNLTLRPVTSGAGASPETPLYLVILEEATAPAQAAPDGTADMVAPDGPRDPATADAKALIASLQQELRAKEESIQNTREELESSTEELKSSNEEMQSVNEEMQSTNEELETSREELQSINEELATVNTELQAKVADLTRTNDDMANLVAGTGIGTVFVDHQLRILRFTAAADTIINLLPGDMGRPVAHIATNLVGYDRLVADTQSVLDTLVPIEVEVHARNGKSFKMRIQPYRTLNHVIEGAVITFMDITEMLRIRDALGKTNDLLRLAVVVRDAHDAVTMQDLEGRTLAWNPGAVRLYGWSEAEALRMNVRDRIPPGLKKEALAKLAQLSRAKILKPYRTQRLSRQGAVVEVSIISTALVDEAGQMYAIATTERAGGTDQS